MTIDERIEALTINLKLVSRDRGFPALTGSFFTTSNPAP